MATHDDDLPLPRRGTAGVALLVVPIVSVVLVGLAYAAMFTLGAQGRPADGPVVEIEFAGCPAARPLIESRVEAMGLPLRGVVEQGDGFVLTAQLPGDERLVARIPATLARRGVFEVRSEAGQVLLGNEDLAGVHVEMAFLDAPHARLVLTSEAGARLSQHMRANMAGRIAALIDGEVVWERPNLPAEDDGELDLDKLAESDLVRIDFAAETSLVLGHGPLPCAPQVLRVTPVTLP